MSRKSNLIYAYTQAVKSSRKGSYVTRQAQLKTMRLIVDDLVLLRRAPHCWQELSSDQIRKLIGYWESKQLKTETIANKISVLRKICFLMDKACTFPSNKTLGLQLRASQRSSEKPSDAVFTKIEHSITKSIVEFEVYFGLTKSESIKLPGYSITDASIIIYRDIAYNHYDRIVPITTQKQHDVIAKRMQVIKQYDAQDSLLQLASFAKLSALYRSELAILNIEGHSHFREIYAKNRFVVLEKANTKTEAISILQKELGLSSDRLLKEWVK